MEILSHSEAETEGFGETIAKKIRPGAVVALYGPLGAGKTAFVRGALRGMGFSGRVTSPTYALVNEYDSVPKVFHFDLYRLSSAEELLDIGFDDYLREDAVVFIEWSERLGELLPPDACRVCFDHLEENVRHIRVEGL